MSNEVGKTASSPAPPSPGGGNFSETFGQLSGALARAQGEIENAKKSETNPHFKNKYADLASVWDACRAPLSKHGLAVTQAVRTEHTGDRVLETLLVHASGEWMRATMPIMLAQATMQGMGSAITYARRYSLAALVGIAQEDDDGNASGPKPPSDGPRSSAPLAGPRPGPGKPTHKPEGKQEELPAFPSAHAKNEARAELGKRVNETLKARGYSSKLCGDLMQALFGLSKPQELDFMQLETLLHFMETHTVEEAAHVAAGEGINEFFSKYFAENPEKLKK